MISVQIEDFKNFVDEIDTLCKKHWKEIARNKNFVPFSPDYEQYLKLDAAGTLCSATARDDGKLIGYCINFVTPHLHYKSTVWAMNDVFYVEPSMRGAAHGIKLLTCVMDELKKRNVIIFHMHSKNSHDLKPIMDRLGFTAIETIYEKVL